MNTDCKKYDTTFVDYLSLKELKQLSRYISMLKLSNRLIPLSSIGYLIATASIVIKYIISNDIVLSIESFIVPQVFACILLFISIKLGRYSIDEIKVIENKGKARYLNLRK